MKLWKNERFGAFGFCQSRLVTLLVLISSVAVADDTDLGPCAKVRLRFESSETRIPLGTHRMLEIRDGCHLTVRILVGSILELYDNPDSGVDALIVSTNRELIFGSDSPGVQKVLRGELTDEGERAVQKDFNQFMNDSGLKDRTIPLAREAVLVKKQRAVPMHIAFIPTDYSGGINNTETPEVIDTLLQRENLAEGFFEALLELHKVPGVDSVATVLIGSSKTGNPEPEFLTTSAGRSMHVNRRVVSAQAIMDGCRRYAEFVRAQKEPRQIGLVTIVAFDGDFKKLLSPGLWGIKSANQFRDTVEGLRDNGTRHYHDLVEELTIAVGGSLN